MLDNFIQMADNALVGVQMMEKLEILKARPVEEAMKHLIIDQQYHPGSLNVYPQFSLLGEALMIYAWQFRHEQKAFIAQDYGVGYQLFAGEADSRLNDPFLILGAEDAPVKGCAFDVHRLAKQVSTNIWHRDTRADEFYLEHSEFNAGTVLEHAAVMAYNMTQGQVYRVHGHPRLLDSIFKSYRRALWRLNGYMPSEFSDAYAQYYKEKEEEGVQE